MMSYKVIIVRCVGGLGWKQMYEGQRNMDFDWKIIYWNYSFILNCRKFLKFYSRKLNSLSFYQQIDRMQFIQFEFPLNITSAELGNCKQSVVVLVSRLLLLCAINKVCKVVEHSLVHHYPTYLTLLGHPETIFDDYVLNREKSCNKGPQVPVEVMQEERMWNHLHLFGM